MSVELKRLEGYARGVHFDLELKPGVTVISGPTGSMKTTALNLLQLVATGSVDANGKRIKQNQSVFRHLGGEVDGKRLEGRLTFEGPDGPFSLSRSLTGKSRPNGSATVSTADDRTGTGEIGDVSRLDIRAFMAQSGPDRRRALIEMCEGFGTEATAEWAQELYLEITGVAAVLVDRMGSGVLSRIEAQTGICRDTARRFRDDARRSHAEATRLDVTEVEGTSHVHEVRLQEIDNEIEEVVQDLARADVGRIRDLGREFDELAKVQTLASAQARLEAASKALEGSPRGEHPEEVVFPSEPDFGDQGEKLTQLRDSTRTAANYASAELQRIGDQARRLKEADECPTCNQIVDEATRQTLLATLCDAKQAAQFTADDAADIVAAGEMMKASQEQDMSDWRKACRDIKEPFDMAVQTAKDLDLKNDELQAAHLEALAAIDTAAGTDRRRAEIRTQMAATPLANIDDLNQTLEALRVQKRSVSAKRDAALAVEQTGVRLAAAKHRARSESAKADEAGAAAKAWDEVMVQASKAILVPFTEACSAILPPEWEVRVDLGDALFRVSRPDHAEVPLSALCNGESSLVMAACSVGVARTSGSPWRVAIVDHAEAMSDWPDEVSEEGLFVHFVKRLQKACDEGLIDQAIVVYSRCPQGAELKALSDVIVEFPQDRHPDGGY